MLGDLGPLTHVVLLRGEGTDAHPGGVGLDHAIHPAHIPGRHAQPGADSAHRAV